MLEHIIEQKIAVLYAGILEIFENGERSITCSQWKLL